MTYRKGQSGNPGGRPKGEKDVIALARQHGPRAVERLAEIMQEDDPKAAVAACKVILDRAYGRVPQPLVGQDENGKNGPLRIVIQRFTDEGEPPQNSR